MIKPCPFCGAGALDLDVPDPTKLNRYQTSYFMMVRCRRCGVEGP